MAKKKQATGNIDARLAALRADIRTLLAGLYMDIGDFGRAEALLHETIDASDPATVPPEIRARTLTQLADLESDKHASDSALGHARQALEVARTAGTAGV